MPRPTCGLLTLVVHLRFRRVNVEVDISSFLLIFIVLVTDNASRRILEYKTVVPRRRYPSRCPSYIAVMRQASREHAPTLQQQSG